MDEIIKIINNPHTDWAAIYIFLAVVGVVIFNAIYQIVAKIKGWKVPKIEEESEEEKQRKRELFHNHICPK
ncbi:MAG: hypothetical protein HZB80_01650 [Deltaproteobacteria bacterium]|nr:hypothetical protein [Deltaproteobacteria bacterium]